MRVNLDSEALTDPRVAKRMPRKTGLGAFDVLGRLIWIWHLCYSRRTALVSMQDVDDTADHDGFAAAMVASDLADQADDAAIRVRGVESRIGYLLDQQEAASKGGKARAAAAARVGGRFVAGHRQPDAVDSPAGNQLAAGDAQPAPGDAPADSYQPPADPDLDPSPSPSPVPDLVLVPDHDPVPDRKRRRKPTATAVVPDQQPVKDRFADLYRKQTGEPYTFTAADHGTVKRLVKEHSAEKVIAKIEILFSGKTWIKPPFTIGTLASQWNAIVEVKVVAAQRGQIAAVVCDRPDGEQAI